ncbi:RNA-guided endonuclease InsQ/TnpB family protein [Cylindrospermum sp. FACHB-282]|uniref:RNA-guided endonuclease InsQ/TnpB family protein n=1 Tax=Cylindrospermum sp. FACHB-282 TaxID=2692794 RepID=UPI001683C8C2|nr:RNA-guided endonuclease TnpB family protein [Cylindrospermum sp. FACHB-282]MBD2388645.1 IS200/IS605 family element transposase accessory protein TnpB [Cylindrospermum sp. FACHB-282]
MFVLEYKINGKQQQYRAIDEAIRTTQFIRNKAIRYWMDAPKEQKVDKIALNNYSTALRKGFGFVKDLNSMACQAATERAWLAIARFYDNCKSRKPGKKGFPRFQKDNRSVEYKTSGWSLHPTKRRIIFTDKKGIGEVKLLGKWDIHTYPVKSIKRVRLVRKADGYYCQFAVDVEVKHESRTGNGELGLDVGLEFFYSDSNGHHEENPRFLRKAEKAIKHAQRQIYRKEKGKNQRRIARRRYAKKHLRVSRQRNEHAKRIARNVCKANALVAYENLNVKGMVKNHCLAKSINDVAWTLFRSWLEYFAAKFGTTVVAVNPSMTSQKCSDCGVIVKKSLSTRTHKCNCGCDLQRDVNAAINILNLGRQARDGQSRSNAVGVGTSTLLGEPARSWGKPP